MAEQSASAPSLGTIASTLATLGAGLSVAHEWAFFKTLGVNFLALTSAQDYLRLLVEWAPLTGVGLVGAFLFSLLTTRIERGMTEEEIVAGAKNKKAVRLFRRSGDWAATITFFLVSTGNFLFNVAYQGASGALLFSFIWMCFVLFLLSHESTRKRIAELGHFHFAFIPILVAISAGAGRDEAFAFLTGTEAPKAELLLKKEANAYAAVKERVVLVRILERGVLVLSRPAPSALPISYEIADIKFVRWDSIDQLNAQSVADFSSPMICRMMGYFCVPSVGLSKIPPK